MTKLAVALAFATLSAVALPGAGIRGTAPSPNTHRSPVTVYVLEGEFTLELEGRQPVTIRSGPSYVEPPHVRMTGYNRSSSERLRVVIFYVSEPGTPFLDAGEAARPAR